MLFWSDVSTNSEICEFMQGHIVRLFQDVFTWKVETGASCRCPRVSIHMGLFHFKGPKVSMNLFQYIFYTLYYTYIFHWTIIYYKTVQE